jgi:hypothetical protein
MLAFKALVTSQLQWRNAEIRFCSVSQSGFEPSLSGFVPAPTGTFLAAGRRTLTRSFSLRRSRKRTAPPSLIMDSTHHTSAPDWVPEGMEDDPHFACRLMPGVITPPGDVRLRRPAKRR